MSAEWERFKADADTDEWAELADALGVDYSDDDLTSRAIRKRVIAWCGDDLARWDRAWMTARDLGR